MTHDDRINAVARQTAQAITVAVRVLRIPTLVLLVMPLPFIALIIWLGVRGDGLGAAIALGFGLGMALISVAFAWRRRTMLRAAEDIEPLTSQIAIALAMSDNIDETRTAISQAAGSGVGFFQRLHGAWNASQAPGRWIQTVNDLPLARPFFPPRLAVSLKLSVMAMALIPLSVVVSIFVAIGALAGTI